MSSTFRLGVKEKLLKIIVEHSSKVSLLLFVASIGFLLSWPYQAKNTYFSENALSVGTADDKFFYSKPSHTFESLGLETHKTNQAIQAKWRAPRGNGKESILLGANHTPHNEQFLISVAKHLVNAKWLHHDIIIFLYKNNTEFDPTFTSHGIIRQAIFMDFPTFEFSHILLATEGWNGQLPNLDFLNVVAFYLSRQGYQVQYTDKIFSIDPKYDDLLHHFWNLLKSEPTGRHADFRQYGTHSLTIRGIGSNGSALSNMERIGNVLIPTIRCLNNLIEQLHHSYFQYFMISPNQFMGFDEFLPNLLLLLGSVLLLVDFSSLVITSDILSIIAIVFGSMVIHSYKMYFAYLILVIVGLLLNGNIKIFQNDYCIFVFLSLCSIIVSHPALFIACAIYSYILLQFRRLHFALGIPLLLITSPFPLLLIAKHMFATYLTFLLIPSWIFTLKQFIVFKSKLD